MILVIGEFLIYHVNVMYCILCDLMISACVQS